MATGAVVYAVPLAYLRIWPPEPHSGGDVISIPADVFWAVLVGPVVAIVAAVLASIVVALAAALGLGTRPAGVSTLVVAAALTFRATGTPDRARAEIAAANKQAFDQAAAGDFDRLPPGTSATGPLGDEVGSAVGGIDQWLRTTPNPPSETLHVLYAYLWSGPAKSASDLDRHLRARLINALATADGVPATLDLLATDPDRLSEAVLTPDGSSVAAAFDTDRAAVAAFATTQMRTAGGARWRKIWLLAGWPDAADDQRSLMLSSAVAWLDDDPSLAGALYANFLVPPAPGLELESAELGFIERDIGTEPAKWRWQSDQSSQFVVSRLPGLLASGGVAAVLPFAKINGLYERLRSDDCASGLARLSDADLLRLADAFGDADSMSWQQREADAYFRFLAKDDCSAMARLPRPQNRNEERAIRTTVARTVIHPTSRWCTGRGDRTALEDAAARLRELEGDPSIIRALESRAEGRRAPIALP